MWVVPQKRPYFGPLVIGQAHGGHTHTVPPVAQMSTEPRRVSAQEMFVEGFDAVIFDRDGVLTYFAEDEIQAFFASRLPISVGTLIGRWQAWGTRVGFPRSTDEEDAFFRGFWNSLADELQLTSAVRTELLTLSYTQFIHPFADARPALVAARAAGLRIGVLSNFSLASLNESLQIVGLADLVDIACAATVIGASKPDPAAYNTVLRALQVSPERCLFFDDEQPCVDGARAVGMHAYLVDRGLRSVSQRHVVPSLASLTDVLADSES